MNGFSCMLLIYLVSSLLFLYLVHCFSFKSSDGGRSPDIICMSGYI